MSYPLDLNILWFLLVGVLLTGYAILDGFDLGTGMLLLRTKDDMQRRIMLNAIGPVWDGNEVWLVVGGGALFAAFPHVYATVFSGFYLALYLLLSALIFRAVAIEFRSREEGRKWRQFWDTAFCVSSFVIALLLGVALGNIVVGIPIGADREYTGGFFNLLNPLALVLGLTTVAMFYMHGAIYLSLKVEGELLDKTKAWMKQGIGAFGVMFLLLSVATFFFAPQMALSFANKPWLIAIPIVGALIIANIPREVHHGRYLLAFASSSGSIAALMALFGLGIFPNIVPDIANINSLTIYNAASSQATLTIMTTIAICGMPFVIAYTIGIYWVFRGKVLIEELHY